MRTPKNTPDAAPQPMASTREPESQDPRALVVAIENINILAQGGFDQIAALARLLLQSMELPAFYRQTDTLAFVLEAIAAQAEDVGNSCNDEASAVGCGRTDAAWNRRMDAERAARDDCPPFGLGRAA